MATMQKITTNLWFDNQAEEAAKYYTSIFRNSKIGTIAHYGEAGKEIHKQPPGSVMTVAFTLEGQEFLALNGGPLFKFNESISFIINCADQQEIDYYWEKLTAGGDPKAQVCGWLKDKFGVSWQVVSNRMAEMMSNPDQGRLDRVMTEVMKMKKIDIATLEKAYENDK